MTGELPHTFEQVILSGWQAELGATCDPSIKQQCLEREPKLLPRFAEHYQQLKASRCRVHRRSQYQLIKQRFLKCPSGSLTFQPLAVKRYNGNDVSP